MLCFQSSVNSGKPPCMLVDKSFQPAICWLMKYPETAAKGLLSISENTYVELRPEVAEWKCYEERVNNS